MSFASCRKWYTLACPVDRRDGDGAAETEYLPLQKVRASVYRQSVREEGAAAAAWYADSIGIADYAPDTVGCVLLDEAHCYRIVQVIESGRYAALWLTEELRS